MCAKNESSMSENRVLQADEDTKEGERDNDGMYICGRRGCFQVCSDGCLTHHHQLVSTLPSVRTKKKK